MADEEEQEKSGFVVKDRRRFDAEGNEKQGEERRAEQRAAARADATVQDSPSPDGVETVQSESIGEHPEIDFSSFVMSLATQALMQLGEIKPPPGVEIGRDVAGAKQTIDIIEMLQRKIQSGLEQDEQRLLEEILHNLRISFVRNS